MADLRSEHGERWTSSASPGAAALDRVEARFRPLFDSRAVGFVVSDARGVLRQANETFLRMLGAIFFDPLILDMVDVIFSNDLGDDADFRCPGSSVIFCDNRGENFVSFGGFSGISGMKLIADLVFETLMAGETGLSMMITSPFDDGSGGEVAVMVLSTPAPIVVTPEPGTLSMACLGLLGLAALRRRSS